MMINNSTIHISIKEFRVYVTNPVTDKTSCLGTFKILEEAIDLLDPNKVKRINLHQWVGESGLLYTIKDTISFKF